MKQVRHCSQPLGPVGLEPHWTRLFVSPVLSRTEVFLESPNRIGGIGRRKKLLQRIRYAGEEIAIFELHFVECTNKVRYAMGSGCTRSLPDRNRTDGASAVVFALNTISIRRTASLGCPQIRPSSRLRESGTPIMSFWISDMPKLQYRRLLHEVYGR
jgi:hypothetical protein